ncbi:unnamed protein product [Adineta ricciae]|uniref:UDENN domain-containing protein n=1 Tax=Adineta ricciae TaxID=249248 RepID=A0A813VCB0_ADIRI|nr:unnamed protein product [Adineta ricciae]CAF1566596.1 unnamed protein product [Adineta ricciae]
MRSNRSDHHLYTTYSLNSKVENDPNDRDTLSCDNFNIQQSSGLHYLSPQTSQRRTSTKRRQNSVTIDSNGLIINGALFDKNLFQPASSSYILDFGKTPKEANRFLDTHRTPTKTAHVESRLFKLSFVLTVAEWNVDKELLIDFCPRENNKNHVIDEINHYKKFCFPELNSKQADRGKLVEESTTYVFTRTSSKGQVEYGYCRRINYNDKQITYFPVVICIVAIYPYFKLYDAILTELSRVYTDNEHECSALMQKLYATPLPLPSLNASSSIICKLDDHRIFYYVCPYDTRLNHDYFYTLLSSLAPNHIVYLFESMLRSKKILCYSHSLTKLTKCCLALSFLIYPFMWPYPFVSVMPSPWLQDLVGSPCPYIYGCLHQSIELLPSSIEGDFLRVDIDANTIDIDVEDGTVLPLDLRQTLQASLEYASRFRIGKPNTTLINVAASEACLHVFTELLYRLPEFFKRDRSSSGSSNDTQHFSICSNYFQNEASGVDLQLNDNEHQLVKNECDKKEENRLGYDFRSDEFLILQPTSSYVTFLNDFIHGMIFLKFLDDYERIDDSPKQSFSLFTQRLKERRAMTMDTLSINPVARYRQTFDLLEKQINQAAKSANPFLSKLVKKFFE